MTVLTLRLKKTSEILYKKKHYPIIEKKYIEQLPPYEEGQIFHLKDANSRFVAKGYMGKQNKGLGWILTYNETQFINDEFFSDKIKEAYDRRLYFRDNGETNAYRAFNGEGDAIGGLTIDDYKGYMVITWYSQGIYSFKKQILEAVLLLNPKGVYEKKRFDEQGKFIDEPSFLYGEPAPEPLIIKENNVNYAVYLDDGAMTGIFLDQKEVRGRIKDYYAKGKRVLNTFSYTGAFSVAAKVGEATHTTSVDLAKRSFDKTREQFLVNNIDPETEDIVVMDVFNYFKWAIKKNKIFDMVILDPPAFAKSKKLTFSVAKDYTWLIENAIDLCAPGGIIVASTNSAKLPADKFYKLIHEGFTNKSTKYKVLETYHLPADFRYSEEYPAGNYLKVIFLQKG